MRRLHNPGGVGLSAELFDKDVVVAWEDVGLGDNVHVNVAAEFVFFCQGRVFSLQIFAVSLDVLHHQVLLAQFVSVREMVEDLVVRKAEARVRIKNLALDSPGKRPVDVPLVFNGSSGPTSPFKVRY